MKDSGFTFIEAVMLILILAVMAVVAFPRMQKVSVARVDSAARAVASDIRYAQSLAISTRSNHRVLLTTGGYEVQEDAGTWQTVAHPTRDSNFTVDLISDFNGVQVDSASPPVSVEYSPLGEPVNGAQSFTLSSGGAAPGKKICIQQHTGRVQLVEPGDACP